MPSIFSRLGKTAAKLGRKIRPRVRHGPGHYKRKHLPNLAMITGGVALGVGGDALVSQLSPEEQFPIYAEGEFSPVHQTEDDSFNIFKFVEESEEFEDNSVNQTFLGNSTESDDGWNVTHLVAMHKGSSTARRIKGACLALFLLFLMYIIYRIFRKIKRGCRDEQMDPPRSSKFWGKLPGFPRLLQVFPPSPPPPPPGPTPLKTSDPLYPALFNSATPPGLTPQDLDMWTSLSTNSRCNIKRIIQNVASQSSNTNSDVPSVPSMESTMYDLQRGLPIGTSAGRTPLAPPYPPPTARVQGQVVPSPTAPALGSSHRADQPTQNGGHTADDIPNKAGEALARLRRAIEEPQ